MKMDDFLWTLAIYDFFCENLNNKNKVEEIYVGLFWKLWHMKCSNHTSYFLYEVYLSYAPFKPYKILN